MAPFFAGRLADGILLAEWTISGSKLRAGNPILNCLFILPWRVGISVLYSAPSELGGFYLLLLEDFFFLFLYEVEIKTFIFSFCPLPFFFFFLWQRIDVWSKAWAWHFSFGPACPICPCIYITMTPWLLSPKHVILSAQTWPLAPAGFKCSEEVEMEMFLWVSLLPGLYTLLSFSSFPCLWPNRQHELHGRTGIMTWNCCGIPKLEDHCMIHSTPWIGCI